MSKHKYTTAVCLLTAIVMITGTALFMMGESLGIAVAHTELPYVSTLFSTDRVHTLDIIVNEDSWAKMLANATAEEYIMCSVVIDGESIKNVGIRPKGNSSLTSIAMSESDRYSFKIEFDHYDSSKSYKGLDKLVLNNIAQDNTYLKDYVSYQMMTAFGADAPLCSFIYITVNGEDWGLYLVAEGIEESFAQRNYGSDYGEIYKPDNLNMNAGPENNENGRFMQMPENGGMPNFEGVMPSWEGGIPEGFAEGGFPVGGGDFGVIEGRGGGGSSDIALAYIDDEYESYSSIFDNAVFNSSNADKDRLIASIKQLNEGTDIEEVINIDEVLRYFVVHNYLLNFDSYTGSMLHNYYLYEEDGVISMIAWDYNLAFGAFSMGGSLGSAEDSATTMANYPIDTPLSGASMEDRPLLNQLLSNKPYLELYHSLFGEFIGGYFGGGEFEKMYDNAVALISPYVIKDPTAFCTYDEFVNAQQMLKEFCLLRAESIEGQLSGSIASTTEAQAASDYSGFVDASHVDMDVMGSNMMGFRRNVNDAMLQTERNPGMAAPDSGTVVSDSGAESPESPSDDFFAQQNAGDAVPSPPAGGSEWNPQGAQNPQDPQDEQDMQNPQDPTDEQNPQNTPEVQRDILPMPNRDMGVTAQAGNNQEYWFLGAALLIILAGLLFAVRYKK